MELAIIAAVAKNRVIGNKGKIPWTIREDLKRFRKLTLNHPVIMGRNTYFSLPTRPLPRRQNIVLSKSGYAPEDKDVIVCKSIDDAVETASNLDNVAYIIGGQQIYEKTLGIVDRMELTHVHKEYEGDSYFPVFDEKDWEVVKREDKLNYSFVSYIRS